MKIKILCYPLGLISLQILSGCSTTRPMIAANGKTYYINTSNCAKYSWRPNEDAIQCYDSDGKNPGFRYPMSRDSINEYNRQQENIRRSFEDFNNTMERNNQRMHQQNMRMIERNQRMLEDMRLNHNLRCIGKPFCTML